MFRIHAVQIKAARAILDWSREDLARLTGLSVNTIRNLETGHISPRGSTVDVIRQAVEDAGLEFTDDEGIKRRKKDIAVFQGADSCDVFFEDMLQSIKRKDDGVIAVLASQEMMALSLGAGEGRNPERLEDLAAFTDVRCLLAEAGEPLDCLSAFAFRTVPKHLANPAFYYVYDGKHALVLREGRHDFRFVVFRSSAHAQSYRDHFNALWDLSAPLLLPAPAKPRRARA